MAPIASKVTILFIQASPPDQAPLDTGTEMNRLEDALWTGLNPTVFDVRTRTATRSQDIEPSLRRHRPQVIHFSGHGSRAGESILNAPGGAASHPLRAEDFAEKLSRYNTENPQEAVRLVVLAGCYTDRAAEVLRKCVDCAVGMADRVDDRAMVDVFTPTLYRALGDGYSVAAAVAEAQQELRDDPRGYVREADAVNHYTRTGMDASALKLTLLVQPVAEICPAHRQYLRQLFEQKWAGVSMSLFHQTLGHKLSLLKIYTPLPVDFAIQAQADAKGRVDWWCGRRGEDLGRAGEAEAPARNLVAELGRRLKRGQADAGFVRPRRWADLAADEQALAPLVALAQKQLAGVKSDRNRKRDEPRATVWEADAHHAALAQQRFVLVGDPGSGKSTFLRYLALCWVGETLRHGNDPAAPPDAGLHALAGWTGPAYTPIYVELRALIAGEAWSLEQAAAPGVPELREHLRLRLAREGCEAFVDELFDLLRAGRAAILLDGLDEVNQAADPRRRAQVQMFVGELAGQFRAAPIIITARPYAYGQDDWRLPGFGHTELTPLDRPRQVNLAGRLFAALADLDPRLTPNGAEQETAAFSADLEQIPADLAGNPLLLTLLMAIWLKTEGCDRCLPSTRGELYRRGLDLLLEDWVRQKVEGFSLEQEYDLTAADLRFVLQLVAYEAQKRRTREDEIAVISRGEIFEALETIGQGDIAAGLLRHLRLRAGMLLEAVEQSPGTLVAVYTQQFRFLHLSFQEYLAACEHLYREGDVRPYHLQVWPDRRFPDALVDRVTQAPALWANVLRLATDELLFQKRAPDAWELLNRCCEPYRTRGEAAEAAAIALGVAEEAGLFTSPPDRRVRADYDDVRGATQRLLVDTRLAPKQRDIAGRLLGDGRRGRGGQQHETDPLLWPPFGHDARKGVGLRPDGLPDIDWAPIPEVDPETGLREFIYQEKQRRVEPTFWMAKYPVTYAQYRAFLEAKDGFANPEWWLGLAAPEGDRKRPGEQRFPYWNHPAERVSWYDAIAFCRWLTEKFKVKVEAKGEGWEKLLPPELARVPGWRITLPTEWQWEKAARGHDGREFPWGKEYVSGNANIDERYGNAGTYYLHKTSAIGMYPCEKPEESPYGVADLSGNVWEWCLNEYENPDNFLETGSVMRVLRGGSWRSIVDNAAASFRLRYFPYSRDDGYGFRVVAVSASP